MNGYEFVEKIIGQTNYDVGPLIKLTDGIETEWLEFKAATIPENGQFDIDTNKWDYLWHISKALFAMANSIGGAVIVGIGEDKNHRAESVSLECSGFTGDKDKFMRKFNEQVLHPKAWKTGTEGTWKCIEPHDLFRPIWGTFNDQPVVIVLVKPRIKEDKWLQLEHNDNKGSHKVILTRSQGDIGRVAIIPDNELTNWWKNRVIERSDLNGRFNSFLSDWKIKGKHSESIITDVVCTYLETFQSKYKNEGLDNIFIPLNAQKLNDNNLNISHSAAENKDILELLDQKTGMILLGDPGSGKSTCLYHKTFSVAKRWQPGMPWLLLVSLYEYTESGLRSLLLKQLPRLYWIDIEAKIANGEITLLLDALNECPTVHYENCYQEINGLLKDYPSARIIISSRLTHTPNFKLPTYDVCPMGYNQQLLFLNSYLDNAEKSKEVLERLYHQHKAELIASSPVLLKMVADVSSDGRDFPTGLAKLYHRSLEVWHQRESEKNIQNGSPPLWSFNLVREALALLSFRMRAEGKISCNINFARDTLVQVMGDDVARFLKRIAQGLLLKVDDKDEYLHFSHETIQEYLAAEYLSDHQDALTGNLLQDSSGKRINSWSMPLVFAFELINNPSKEFLKSAWFAEPLLVAAALRDSRQLNSLPIHEHRDLWLRGVLRAMRNEDSTQETLELSYISHFPPKYPLPNGLISALRGTPFWYSCQTHEEGLERLKRLQDLIFDRSSIWIELIPYISTGQLLWKTNISPAQQVLIDDMEKKDINTALKNATVAELCILLRFKKITTAYFISNWEKALRQSDSNQLPLDLIALLRTNAKLGKNYIKLSQFNNEQKKHLYKIGKNWKLSIRLLNILVRESILTVKDIRDEPGRLEDIISHTSPMNAFRLIKNGIIKQKDIPKERLNELLGGMNRKFITELNDKGLLTNQEVKTSRREKRYSVKDLINEESRKQIDTEIRAQQWEVTVMKTFQDRNFGFVKHPRFTDNAIFWLEDIDNPDFKTITEGDTLQVSLKTQFNNKKSEWGFSVISGRILKKFSKLN